MLEKITDRIYYMNYSETTDRPSLGLIIGDECSLLVDAGNSPRHAKEFMEEIEAMKVSPVKYLVLTHFHWDHVLGLAEWNTTTIAHKATKDYIEKYRNMNYDDKSLEEAKKQGIYNDFAIQSIKTEIEDREHFKVGKIDVYYRDGMSIDLGGVHCELRHMESPHTDDSTIIYIPEEKVMFLGDCIYGHSKEGFNYYDPEKLFLMIEEIEKYETQQYLVAHETLCPRAEIVQFWKELRTAYEITQKCSNLQEAVAEYINIHHMEPGKDFLFYLKSFGMR